ncbi:SH3 domain-containing protein [Labrenzia sp. 011]|uniref:SH3 domain-containing protein n=1 Tax=Labrenzia sp. 011 TaxID=2171494 RepID=UPI0010573120|nr:SH3 domain-containing protein [Labrenzia sp. 011]
MRVFSGFLLIALMAFSSPVHASPDVDFPQPGFSYGGKVRSGPGMKYRQVGSLREGDQILILNGTGTMMNGYEWFKIRYRNGQTGFQWGGIMCSQSPYATILRTCNGPGLHTQAPVSTKRAQPASNAVNGYSVARIVYPGGSFTSTGNGQWQEADTQGRVNFRFHEQARDEWSVYLFDASRNVSLQLDLHRKQVLYGIGNAPKTVLYPITASSGRRR